jgi:transposase
MRPGSRWVEAFEGNKAETATMLPTLTAFMAAHLLTDITVVADAGMLSENNKREIEAAGLGFILGNRFTHIPYVIDEWHTQNPAADTPMGWC